MPRILRREVELECGGIREPGCNGTELFGGPAEDADKHWFALEGMRSFDKVFGRVCTMASDESAVDRDEGGSVMAGNRFGTDGFCHDASCTESEIRFNDAPVVPRIPAARSM